MLPELDEPRAEPKQALQARGDVQIDRARAWLRLAGQGKQLRALVSRRAQSTRQRWPCWPRQRGQHRGRRAGGAPLFKAREIVNRDTRQLVIVNVSSGMDR